MTGTPSKSPSPTSGHLRTAQPQVESAQSSHLSFYSTGWQSTSSTHCIIMAHIQQHRRKYLRKIKMVCTQPTNWSRKNCSSATIYCRSVIIPKQSRASLSMRPKFLASGPKSLQRVESNTTRRSNVQNCTLRSR